MRIVWDERTRLWGGGSHLAGGAPWGLLRLDPRARPFVRRLHAAGPAGTEPTSERERAIARRLVGRGLAHPRPQPTNAGHLDVIVPAYGRAELLDRCLASLGRTRAIVVDDASPDGDAIRTVADRHGATYLRHAVNRGPAAARNTGLARASSALVAFLDSDCTVPPGWLDHLAAHFDDDRVGLVAPRVRPRPSGRSLLARHEDTRSALDMGPRAELVAHGASLGFLPSAALVVRRAALPTGGFDTAMRVGEDVDLVWRLIDDGWLARYEPAVEVLHEMRLQPREWAARRFTYGTSAPSLARRHPGRLAPARTSGWNLAVVVLLLLRRPGPAALVAGIATGGLARVLARSGAGPDQAARIVAKGLVADVVAIGHALRREWWPLGWLGLVTAPRSRWGRLAAASMLGPVALEYVRQRPATDPVRYAGLRLVEDAVYGSGVLTGVVRERHLEALRPEVRLPGLRLRGLQLRGPRLRELIDRRRRGGAAQVDMP